MGGPGSSRRGTAGAARGARPPHGAATAAPRPCLRPGGRLRPCGGDRGRGWGRRNGGSRRCGARATSAASCRGWAERVRPPRGGPPPAEGVKAAPGDAARPGFPLPCPGFPVPRVALGSPLGLHPSLCQGHPGRARSAGEGQSPAAPAGGQPQVLGALGGKVLRVPGNVSGVALLLAVCLAAPGGTAPPWSFPSALRPHREPWVHLTAPQ